MEGGQPKLGLLACMASLIEWLEAEILMNFERPGVSRTIENMII